MGSLYESIDEVTDAKLPGKASKENFSRPYLKPTQVD